MATLEIKTKDQSRTVSFDGLRFTIGRLEGNDLILADPASSRKHCVIEKTADGFKLVDLGSHNGTWIGENKVVEAMLRPGEPFRIGATFIRIIADAKQPKLDDDIPPVAELIEDEDSPDEELPPSQPDRAVVATNIAVRAMAAGPLSKQLAPLMEACINVPPAEGAPGVARDIRLLNRKAVAVKVDDAKTATGDAAIAFRQLLFAAFRTRATDIHIEPKAEVYAIRFRIDGVMHSVGEVTAKMGIAILNVIKILCEQDIAKRNIVQEGSFAVELPSRRVDFRINLTPTTHGQKLALRFLDKGAVPPLFENLGMDLGTVNELQAVCEKDAGMIILAGPTGSGKTTTLYTALQGLDATKRNIITIEDPVEYELQNTTQISIDPVHNLTFASVLSSVLRQDPDVILVGEIRDQETAKLAMQAATTGHLVLTTIHARDTIGTVFRLLDLGVEAFLVANAVTMCISQRLVRTLCPACRKGYRPDAKLIREFGLESRAHGQFFEAVGCRKCMGTGYRGRVALYETLVFNQQVRDVILTNPTISDIRKAAGEWMFNTLQAAGIRKVIEGATTLDEVRKVTG
ncbi:MAG: Flp pilus assembly complex ATPase component TadA [Planctomycetes bacterium]|nr:Flp pilus assembly complex ATPase component TadA [Planctomycetota bacterium]